MKTQTSVNDPARILAHASLYLWKHWRQYALAAWEDAECILRQAYDAVEVEDRIEFMRTLEVSASALSSGDDRSFHYQLDLVAAQP
jgi:hypothetical protein